MLRYCQWNRTVSLNTATKHCLFHVHMFQLELFLNQRAIFFLSLLHRFTHTHTYKLTERQTQWQISLFIVSYDVCDGFDRYLYIRICCQTDDVLCSQCYLWTVNPWQYDPWFEQSDRIKKIIIEYYFTAFILTSYRFKCFLFIIEIFFCQNVVMNYWMI